MAMKAVLDLSQSMLVCLPHFLDSGGNVNIQAGSASTASPSYNNAMQ